MSVSQLRSVLHSRGIEVAFDLACEAVRQQTEHLDSLWASRFFERRELDDGTKKLWPVTERQISQTFDMQDMSGEPIPDYLFCDTDGQLYPVTLGKRDPVNTGEEHPFIYAASDLIANGKVVGCVCYTDH